MLKKNETLTQLDIDENDIGPEGVGAIAGALMKNTTLIALNIDGNQIEQRYLKVIKEALNENTELTKTKDDSKLKERQLAFAMACHPRLGSNSIFHNLPELTLPIILKPGRSPNLLNSLRAIQLKNNVLQH